MAGWKKPNVNSDIPHPVPPGGPLPPATWKNRLDTACSRTVFAGLLLMTAGYLFFPDYGGVARVFYLLVLLPAMIALPLWLRGDSLRPPGPWLVYLVPPAYLALSTLWVGAGDMDPERSIWYYQKPLLFLAFLLLAVRTALGRFPSLPRWLLLAFPPVALVTGLTALAQYLPDAVSSGHWPRMSGISLRGDINVTATLYGLNSVWCAWWLQHASRAWRWPLVASLVVSLALVLLSQSKIPLMLSLAALAGLTWYGLGRASARTSLVFAALLALAMGTYFVCFDRVPFLHRLEGYTVRQNLWLQAWEQVQQHLLWGYGVGTTLELQLGGKPFLSHAHNLVLDTLRYGGLVGALLVVVQMTLVTVAAWQVSRRHSDFVPVAIWWAGGVMFLLTNGQQPLVKPHHIWFFYWLPAALIAARWQLDRARG